ncbi:unnamed protein product, partial [Rotaria sp. Silwood1]
MSMNDSNVNIVGLSDEILLAIFKKLNNFDVLYSLVGVNHKLDRIACDIAFTRDVDLMMISSNEGDVSTTDAILDRFCSDIIPRIHNNMESLTVQASLLQRVLHANSYPNLHKLTLVNLKLNVHYLYYFSQALTSDLSFAKYCSSNIAYLRMKMHYFDDCLYLLDGRLSQLHTFIVDLNHIHEPSAIHLSPSRLIRNSLKLINNA